MKYHKITKRIFTKIKLPVIALMASVVLSAVALAFNANAWGPSRKTYTNNSPADYATFNSITDNAAVGDERNFVRIREAGTDNKYADEIEIIPGHEYEVYIYYHNNAGSDTNASGLGVATNVKVASAYPTLVNSTERGMISGIITWSYVTPDDPNHAKEGKVWDEAYVTSKTDGVVLRYKTGTATIHNSGKANGSVLSTDLFTNDGTPIGYNKLTGTLPGCAEYSGHITYILTAEAPGSELTKQVSTDGENWFDTVTVKPGDYVTYKVVFKNTGTTNFTNLILTDSHDEGLSLRAGSTKVYNTDHPDGYTIDDIIDISGHNTGDSHAGAITQVIYQMQVKNEDSSCDKKMKNTITANFNTTENKTASTEISVECQTPEPEPTPDCSTNPNLPGCGKPDKLPETGPLEITMAVIVILGIGAGGFYFYRTRHALKTVSSAVSGGSTGGAAGGSGPSDTPDADGPIAPASTEGPSESASEPASVSTPASSDSAESATNPEADSLKEPTSSEETPKEPEQPFEPQPPIPPEA